jgi:hypothetical protein
MPVLKNARHELFAQSIAQGKTQAEAYQLAGYKDDRRNASHLRDRPEIEERIRQLTTKNAEKVEITAQYLTNRLIRLADRAEERGNESAAVSALDKAAKINGFGLDKTHVSIENNVTPDADSLRKALLDHVLAGRAGDSEGDKLN